MTQQQLISETMRVGPIEWREASTDMPLGEPIRSSQLDQSRVESVEDAAARLKSNSEGL